MTPVAHQFEFFATDYWIGLYTHGEFIELMDQAVYRLRKVPSEQIKTLQDFLNQIHATIDNDGEEVLDVDFIERWLLKWSLNVPEDAEFVPGFELSFDQLARNRRDARNSN